MIRGDFLTHEIEDWENNGPRAKPRVWTWCGLTTTVESILATRSDEPATCVWCVARVPGLTSVSIKRIP